MRVTLCDHCGKKKEPDDVWYRLETMLRYPKPYQTFDGIKYIIQIKECVKDLCSYECVMHTDTGVKLDNPSV